MATTSVYPVSLDTDTQLSRATTTTALTPPITNNLTNAIEAIEPTVGTMDDGTAYGSPLTFTTPVAHAAGVLTTMQPNPLYPFSPVGAEAFYPVADGLASGWSQSNLTLAYDAPYGWIRAVQASASSAAALYYTDSFGPPEVLVFKVRAILNQSVGSLYLGCSSAAGTISDFCGVVISGLAAGLYVNGTSYDVSFEPPGIDFYSQTGYWLVSVTSDAVAIYFSVDGVIYDLVMSESTGASFSAAYPLIYWDGYTVAVPILLGYIATGVSLPAGAAG